MTITRPTDHARRARAPGRLPCTRTRGFTAPAPGRPRVAPARQDD